MAEAPRLEWKFKIARHDTDDGVGTAVDVDGVTKNGGIGVEALVPERVADDRHRRRAVIFVLRERAAQQRRYAKYRKKRRRHTFRAYMERLPCSGQFVLSRNKPAQPGKRMVVARELNHIGGRQRTFKGMG